MSKAGIYTWDDVINIAGTTGNEYLKKLVREGALSTELPRSRGGKTSKRFYSENNIYEIGIICILREVGFTTSSALTIAQLVMIQSIARPDVLMVSNWRGVKLSVNVNDVLAEIKSRLPS